MSGGDVNQWVPEDPWYEIQRRQGTIGHSVSGKGMYCPAEHKLFDPPSGLSRGDDCHEEARRGSDTGTQSNDRSSAERAKLPYDLSRAILEAVEGRQRQSTLVAAVDGGRNSRERGTENSSGGEGQ